MPARAGRLFWRSKVLIAERGLVRALDANKRLAGGRVAAVAALGEAIEGGDELRAVLALDRLFKPLDARIDDGLDHLGNRNPVKRRMKPCRVLKALLDLVDFIGGQGPAVVLAGE